MVRTGAQRLRDLLAGEPLVEGDGKTTCYALRWLGRDGRPGFWSETVAATIGA